MAIIDLRNFAVVETRGDIMYTEMDDDGSEYVAQGQLVVLLRDARVR